MHNLDKSRRLDCGASYKTFANENDNEKTNTANVENDYMAHSQIEYAKSNQGKKFSSILII